ncbi:oligosaccharide flippase family protein [Parabacteroides sp.]|uniref:lipopolysaccharide biosynthesis protein n=1 Tax=Parabacteroides sp. TaxID=1869337 RepID=UPI0025797C12|nr:oligosaccharide flippase family protein [Parabacteroides sp.]
MNLRAKELFSNTFLFAIAQLGAKVMVFLMVPFYTSVLSVEEYGESDLIFTLIAVMTPIFSMCIADAVLRFCFLERVNPKRLISIGFWTIVFGTVISVVVVIILGRLSFFNDIRSYLAFVPILFFLQASYNLFNQFARGINKVKFSAVSGLVYTFTLVVSNIFLLAFIKLGILGYLISFVISDIVSIIYLSISCKMITYVGWEFDKKTSKEMYRYSVPLIPNSLSWWLLNSFSRFIIKDNLGIDAVGVFSATLRIPTILTVLCDIFSQAWLLSALKDYGTEESKQFVRYVYKRYVIVITLITGCIISLSYPISKLLLVGEFGSHWYITPFLFIGVYLGALSGFLGAICSAEKKTYIHFTTTIVGGIFMVVFSELFVGSLGLNAVAISTMFGYFLIWLLRYIYIKRILDVGVSLRYGILCFVLLLSIALSVYFSQYFIVISLIFIYCVVNRLMIFEIIRKLYLEIVEIVISKLK